MRACIFMFYIGYGCHKFTRANQNKFCVLCYFRGGHSLEVVTNLCFATLIDLSNYTCELL